MSAHLVVSVEDRSYVDRHFLALSMLAPALGHDERVVAGWIAARRFPGPTYLVDGVGRFPPDVFSLMQAAGGIEALPAHFVRRYTAAVHRFGAHSAAEAAAEWDSYLSGGYGACLWHVTPEHIVRKEQLVALIGAATTPSDELKAWVDELDALERPFAQCDREAYGGSVSRDRCITAVRRAYGWAA